jgi:quinol monooxygenase YgiN
LFKDEACEETHLASAATARFVDVLYPLLEGDIIFERWNPVASTTAPRLV